MPESLHSSPSFSASLFQLYSLRISFFPRQKSKAHISVGEAGKMYLCESWNCECVSLIII